MPLLQLSHVHSNVETLAVGSAPVRYCIASIEPRSFKRGNLDLEAFARGAARVLQLSHVHSNVETSFKPSLSLLTSASLQLSHVHSNVETTYAKIVAGGQAERFN